MLPGVICCQPLNTSVLWPWLCCASNTGRRTPSGWPHTNRGPPPPPHRERPRAAMACARACDHGQIGRVGAEPFLGLLGVDRGLHGLTDLVGREQQVVLD